MTKPEDAEGWNYCPVSEIHCRNRENAAPRIPYAFDFKYRLAAKKSIYLMEKTNGAKRLAPHGSGFRRRGKRRLNFAYFHLRDVRSQLDPRLCDLGLKRFTLGFKVGSCPRRS